MLKRSDSGFASKAVKLYMYIVVYNETQCCLAIYKPNLCCYLVWLFFENWCINVFTMVIIQADFEEERMLKE